MQSHRSNGAKAAWAEWHQFRQRAREESFSPADYSPEERVLYNLDNDDPLYPARIYGDENPDTYTIEDRVSGDSEPHDVRDLDDR